LEEKCFPDTTVIPQVPTSSGHIRKAKDGLARGVSSRPNHRSVGRESLRQRKHMGGLSPIGTALQKLILVRFSGCGIFVLTTDQMRFRRDLPNRKPQ